MAEPRYARLGHLLPHRRAAEPPRLPPGMRVYAIGDVHGEAALLRDLLGQIATDAAARGPAETFMVFLGDVIDRGPDGAALLTSLAGPADDHLILLKGNHEAALVDACRGNEDALRFWLDYGGGATLAGFGVAVADDEDLAVAGERVRAAVPEALVAWVDALPLGWTLGSYLFAHAGIRPGVPLDRQTEADLLWIREPFLSHRRAHEKVVVHGHTIEPGLPALGGVRIGIDTGANARGVLTALCLEGDRQWLLQATRERAATAPDLAETVPA